ncbi:MAG: DMT family transporter [Oscillospiraceae bacterium]|jgi:drug/metabolite transporter (DMT)-like permease|nr:DMT family transporter [Oscillospiraceae bacterium]
MKIRDSFHPYAIITILFWSLAYVFTRLALQYFSAFPLGFLRYLIASVTLIIVALAARMKPPKRADIPWFLAAGVFGFFLYMLAFNKGTETVTAATGSVIIATVPVVTALLARVIYREKLSRVKWLATAVEFSGVVVLTLLDGTLTVNAGLLCLFGAAIALSAYNLLQRRLTKTYSALQTSAFSIFAGTLMLAIFLPASVAEVRTAPPVQWFYVAVLGVFSSAVAYAAWSQAFAKAANTSSVSNYMFVTPFLTSLLGFLIAGETPALSTVAGGAIILFGLLVFNFGDKLSAKFKKPA